MLKSWTKNNLICFLALSIWVSGCGYALVGRGSFLPPHIKHIAIPVFENKGFEYRIDTLINQMLIQEFEDIKEITITSESEADAILSGVIKEYKLAPLTISPDGTIQEYRIVIRVDVKFTDLKTDEVRLELSDYRFTADYEASANLDERLETQREAWELAASDFAEWLIDTIVEGF